MSFKDHRTGRIFVFKFLYQILQKELQDAGKKSLSDYEFQDDLDYLLTDFIQSYQEQDLEHKDNQFSPESYQYALNILKVTLAKIPFYEKKIFEFLSRGQRPNLVEMALLLAAIGEKNLGDHVTKSVIINEFVELSKTYGRQDSSKLVNALLDKIL